MKKHLQIKMPEKNQTAAKAFIKNRCTEFFIGWMKRFGHTLILFVFPLEQERAPKPLKPNTHTK